MLSDQAQQESLVESHKVPYCFYPYSFFSIIDIWDFIKHGPIRIFMDDSKLLKVVNREQTNF